MRYYHELFSYIPQNAALFLCSAFGLLFVSLFFLFRYPRSRWNYALLFGATALFGFGFALMDWYLHPWDEQFHALVAKNMANGNPFHPVLLDGDQAQLDYRKWVNNETWLHKQPLFLWQIALSVKIFGANVLAVRLPSILLHAATTLFVFSIAKRYLSYFFAVLAAVLFGFSGLLNDYISGAMGMDHNDVAFVFYVTASFWAWLKYRETPTVKWLVLIGVFAAGAVLCKWLTGLAVYAAWGFIVLFRERQLRSWKHLFGSFGVAVLIAAPWQIWCAVAFPKEFAWEMQYNSLHLFQSVELHAGDSWFYWHGMKAVYGAGELMRVIVLIGLAIAWYIGLKHRKKEWLFAAFAFTFVYAFFTVAATKLPGYVLIVSAFGFIFLLLPIDQLMQRFRDARTFEKKSANLLTPPEDSTIAGFSPVTTMRRSTKGWKLSWWSSPLIVAMVLFLHFNPKGVIGRHYYRDPEVINTWQRELVQGSQRIRADKEHACFVVINASASIAPALRFMTGREIYGAGAQTGSNCAVIDLQESRPAMRSAN